MKTSARFTKAKAQADLVSLFASYGIELKKNGKGFKGLCPWHEDRSPSLSVSPDKGLFHCFGCGRAGSAIDLVMFQEGVTQGEAVDRLLGPKPKKSRKRSSQWNYQKRSSCMR